MLNKKQARLRRARRTRLKIAELKVPRLTVFRSNLHIYAQVIDASGGRVVASASTLEPDVRKDLPRGHTIAAAALVLLARFKVPEPILIAAAGLAGIAIFTLRG